MEKSKGEVEKDRDVEEVCKIDTLVLSGGGVKGIAYVGVFRRLRELDVKIREVCAVSVGSIMGLLYILGYDYEELVSEIRSQNFDSLKDINIGNFVSRYGIDSGRNVVRWVESLLVGKGYSGGITFLEMYKLTGVRYRVLVTNLNRYEQVIFDDINSPNMKVTRAIRMSISIPFIFTVQRYNGEIYVDGALVNNYPIDLYVNCLERVVGVVVETSVERGESGKIMQVIGDIGSYIYNVMNCFLIHKSKSIGVECRGRTLSVCLDRIVSTMSFDIGDDMKEILLECGYRSACDFFRKSCEKKINNVDKSVDNGGG